MGRDETAEKTSTLKLDPTSVQSDALGTTSSQDTAVGAISPKP